MCHHTAGPKNGNMPSLRTVTEGRSDLSGPLAQLCLGRDGTYYVVSAGRCNHAGAGEWQGITSGNTNFIGIEAENTGTSDDPWPEVQMDAYRRGG
ncbi:MAG: N-acetylmuramoyl-L-alanine amidase [Methylococcaceae bacterium]